MLCQTCKKAIFDAQWGEYKCSSTGLVYHNLALCGEYDKGTPTESKENEEYNILREDGE